MKGRCLVIGQRYLVMVNNIELLAPAGNYEAFIGAINAGCDAVYLGGTKYSARAYADNFSDGDILRAISYAHLFQKKVYMTINTLCKDSEMEDLLNYIEPFYKEGLDGVIIQDIGVFIKIRERYPLLPLHVSTQMTVTGVEGANMLKELGAVRIVPARELSLDEIRTIKESTSLEIETFIHGAMCYCYSGQCLFSSILGARSGNRGKCAQPCRLPYTVNGQKNKNKDQYPLSLKDMCTISIIPELIEAGICSFKIEGRMKKPEYVAGVTAIYRKYIDLYLKYGKDKYHVSKEDMDHLSKLYIRSDVQEGYYHKQNGSEMISIESPSYNKTDENLLANIRNTYLKTQLKVKIRIDANFHYNESADITITAIDNTGSVKVIGSIPQKATNAPISKDNILKSLSKLGNSHFIADVSDISIHLDEGLFFSLKEINELRRNAIEKLENLLLHDYKRVTIISTNPMINEDKYCKEEKSKIYNSPIKNQVNESYSVLASTIEQLDALFIYKDSIKDLYVESNLFLTNEDKISDWNKYTNVFMALPYIIRKKDANKMFVLYKKSEQICGFLVRNIEGLSFLKKMQYQGKIRTDASLYCFNRESLNYYLKTVEQCCLPYELNARELKTLQIGYELDTEQIVYGRIPLMITANCIAKTTGKCFMKESGTQFLLTDRMNKQFPVITCCSFCYNIIYNSIPLSLHESIKLNDIPQEKRIQFTIETKKEVMNIMDFFCKDNCDVSKIPYKEYTLGHRKRGV